MSRKVAAEIKKHAGVFANRQDASFNPEFYRGGAHATKEIAESCARVFAAGNPRFDRERFLTACGVN